MIFYIDNKIDQKKDFTHKELIENFIKNENAYNNFLFGNDFRSCFLNAMPGSPEPLMISEKNWKALWLEFKKQVPNPNYKY